MKDVQELNQVSKHSYFASMVENQVGGDSTFFLFKQRNVFPLRGKLR